MHCASRGYRYWWTSHCIIEMSGRKCKKLLTCYECPSARIKTFTSTIRVYSRSCGLFQTVAFRLPDFGKNWPLIYHFLDPGQHRYIQNCWSFYYITMVYCLWNKTLISYHRKSICIQIRVMHTKSKPAYVGVKIDFMRYILDFGVDNHNSTETGHGFPNRVSSQWCFMRPMIK